jgi:tRNA (cytosine49-C5)-methyltransferase
MHKNNLHLPPQLVERWHLLFAEEELQEILTVLSCKRPTTLRVNTLKITTEAFEQEAKSAGVILSPIVYLKDAYILDTPDLKTFTSLPLYVDGHCYVQSLSSMIPPLILDPKPNETILDIAAAPGSKTTQMAMYMQNSGSIVANDSSHIRIYKLEANLKTQGVTNTMVKKGLGQLIWQEYKDYFDKTLVDVPCSMEGRILTTDPKTYAHWSTGKVKELSHTQRFLLRSALTATKPGGILVYSTCTLSPEENEGVISWLHEKEPGSFTVEEIDLTDEIPQKPGITKWKERQYPPDVSKTRRILPSALFEGFYIAKLKKKIS